MSNQVEVTVVPASQATVEVSGSDTPSVIELSVVGPQGPPGAAFSTYTHVQSTPATIWTINHNLGYRPSVELLDSGSQEIEGDVIHPSLNQTIVTLTPATAGVARLT